MRAYLTQDKEQALRLIKQCWHNYAEEGQDLESYKVSLLGKYFLVLEDEKGEAGFCLIKPWGAYAVEIHPYALPKRCKKWKSIIKYTLKWIYDTKKIQKVLAFVGTSHSFTYKQALRLGFDDEGLIKKSYFKNGRLEDQHVIGISRDKIKEVIE